MSNLLLMLSELSPCLWSSFLWLCSDFINHEYSIFNVWSAFTALWVLVAAYQMVNDEYKFRLNFRSKLFSLSKFLIFSSFTLVLVGDIMPIAGANNPLFGYTLFWEIISAIMFSSGIAIWYFSATLKIRKIDVGDIGKLENLYIWYLAKGEESTKMLATQFWDFFPSLFVLMKKEDDTIKNTIMLFTDFTLLRAISNNPFTLHIIFSTYLANTQTLYEDIETPIERLATIDDNWFLKNVFNAILSNNDSIIVRELHGKNFSQVNRWSGIFTLDLLSNPELILWYSLLEGFDYLDPGKPSEDYYKNYLAFWIKALEVSLFSRNISFSHNWFEEALEAWFRIIDWMISSKKDMQEANRSLYWLSNFKHLLIENTDRILIWFQEWQIPSPILREKKDWEYEKYDIFNKNLIDVIALGIEEILETLARDMDNTDTSFWIDRMTCMHIMEVIDDDGNAVLNALKTRVELLFKKHIFWKNLLGWYPMWLPIFFHAFWWQIFQEYSKTGDISNSFYKEILRALRDKLPRISEWYVWWVQEAVTDFAKKKSEKIMKDLLPPNMEYVSESNSLIYYYGERESSDVIELDKL